MISYSEALQIAQQMYIDSGATDLELGAARVCRDLTKIAQNEDSPLAAVEAYEICMALARGPDSEEKGTQQ